MLKLKQFICPVLFFTSFFIGCYSLTHESEVELFEIHLQERFENNIVRVELNDNLIFEDQISSNRAGLAKVLVFNVEAPFDPAEVMTSIPIQLKKDEHHVRVWVDDTLSKDTKFILKDTLFIGVRYNMDFDHKIEIQINEKVFTYL